MNVRIEKGRTLADTEMFELIDERTGEPACGFFNSPAEALAYAKQKGWEVSK